MSSTTENIELENFYSAWMQDIIAMQQSSEEGSSSEQIFTQGALDLLAEAGEVENTRLAYDEKALGTAKQHKINAYAISENYETVDLFISIYKGTSDISKTSSDEIEQASKRISNFFRKAIYSNDLEKSKIYNIEYVDQVEESSEIFQFANTLGREENVRENLVRVNATILTNGLCSVDFPKNTEISGYKVYFKIFDIQSLYNVSEKSNIPIEINFLEEGFEVPCIASPSTNSEYQSYLAIIPGAALASIYERFGSRLLEQNVRSFLQFSGKINKGIRSTILGSPHMFLAYNNGIAATAIAVGLRVNPTGDGLLLTSVNDLQIVNGGQTTASIYHTWKKDKVDISSVFVQLKLSVIKNNDNFSDIVAKISEYANTQNRVSIADLSSNRPFHIDLEKLSRSIYTPVSERFTMQTRWFYERARGQYKNARLKEGFTKARQKAFDLKNPKQQMFSKEELAKYVNAYQNTMDGRKIIIGPHFVVRGSQKNYIQFMNYNVPKNVDNVYFEDTIAKALVFRAAEKVYGVKPNSIGDMRYITVPYAVSLLTHLTNNQLDLYKIWRNQDVSENLKRFLLPLMKHVESSIKTTAPGGLYGEWAKKEDCWQHIKHSKFDYEFDQLKPDFVDNKRPHKRHVTTDTEILQQLIDEQVRTLKSISQDAWKKIEEFGYQTKLLSELQCNVIFTIRGRLRTNAKFSDNERAVGLKVLDIILEKAPDLLLEEVQDTSPMSAIPSVSPEITVELLTRMVDWERNRKRLKAHQYTLMLNILNGKEALSPLNAKYCQHYYQLIRKLGFK